MSIIPDGVVDMILTDLPYGITSSPWDILLPLDSLWQQLNRVLKPNGAAVLTACQPFTTTLINSNRKYFKYCWYWNKNQAIGFCFAKYQPMRCMEDIVVFYRKMPTYHAQGLVKLDKPIASCARPFKADGIYKPMSKPYTTEFTGYPKNLLQFKSERGYHPTQKPVDLFEYMIRTYTDPNELVLDCCMGSGTTAVACVRAGRQYVGFEIDEGYYKVAQERIANIRIAEKF